MGRKYGQTHQRRGTANVNMDIDSVLFPIPDKSNPLEKSSGSTTA